MDSAAGGVSSLISSQFIDILLSVFLFVWFICGNYWVLSVWRPNYRQTLAEPNSWCDKTTYLLVAVQLCVCVSWWCDKTTYLLAAVQLCVCVSWWCDKTTYLLAAAQLSVCYGLMIFIAVVTVLLAILQRVWTSQA